MKKMSVLTCAVVAALTLLSCSNSVSGYPPHFRGPLGDGIGSGYYAVEVVKP